MNLLAYKNNNIWMLGGYSYLIGFTRNRGYDSKSQPETEN
jgi:hypothetical protein